MVTEAPAFQEVTVDEDSYRLSGHDYRVIRTLADHIYNSYACYGCTSDDPCTVCLALSLLNYETRPITPSPEAAIAAIKFLLAQLHQDECSCDAYDDIVCPRCVGIYVLVACRINRKEG